MCEFCHKHGDGKKWYLQAKNWSDDLLSDMRRREFIVDFLSHPEHLRRDLDSLDRLASVPPFVRRAISGTVTRRMKRTHFGQVLPLEDIKEIFKFSNSITRTPCICRQAMLGRDEAYCYGVSVGPGSRGIGGVFADLAPDYSSGPDASGVDVLTPEEALELFAAHEKEGLCHTVWTFMAPYTGGICNCDRAHCGAMISTVTHDVKVMFRAEYVAVANPDLCTGCRSCMRVCQFGAIAYGAADRKITIDQTACYGCGICRTACPKDAIELRPRAEQPVAAELW
jgi:NAD-dependent dihydropyrimidine dehydrogenase PreA subunit